MVAYLIVTLIVAFLVFAMNVIRIKGKDEEETMLDVLQKNPVYNDYKKLYDAVQVLNEGGTDKDQILEGYGDFGYERTNPIPVNSVLGIPGYLGRLRTDTGLKVQYERVGTTTSSNVNGIIDIYEVTINNNKITELYISPYNKKTSELAPEGFKLSFLP